MSVVLDEESNSNVVLNFNLFMFDYRHMKTIYDLDYVCVLNTYTKSVFVKIVYFDMFRTVVVSYHILHLQIKSFYGEENCKDEGEENGNVLMIWYFEYA